MSVLGFQAFMTCIAVLICMSRVFCADGDVTLLTSTHPDAVAALGLTGISTPHDACVHMN